MIKILLIHNYSRNFGPVKIKHLAFIYCLFVASTSYAQSVLDVELHPIEQIQQGFGKKFVYKRQVIDNPQALQIPLLEAKDPVVSYEFLKFKQQRKQMVWISGITTAISFYSLLQRNRVSDGFYLSMIGATGLVNLYVGSVSMKHFHHALDRYNALANNGAKISLHVLPDGRTGQTVACRWTYNF